MSELGPRLSGVVVAFDEGRGTGTIRADGGGDHEFHCVELLDGTRRIAVGTEVTFELLPKLGRYEAGAIAG